MGKVVTCGIYIIEHCESGLYYIGSSVDINVRWYQHTRDLKMGRHANYLLQEIWAAYGADALEFSVLEECERDRLMSLEQAYLDAHRPPLNIATRVGAGPGWDHWTEESREKFRAMVRERAARITHCPQGHEYTEANTGHNQGKRICRACAAEWARAKLAVETLEQREGRIKRTKAYYEANKEALDAQMREYAAARKEEKRAYDQTRADLKAERDRERRQNRTPEEHAAHLERKRAYYERNREKVKEQLRQAYQRRRARQNV